MKNYKLELNEQKKRLVEAVLFNEKHYYESKKSDETFDSDYEMLEMINTILRKLKVEVK